MATVFLAYNNTNRRVSFKPTVRDGDKDGFKHENECPS